MYNSNCLQNDKIIQAANDIKNAIKSMNELHNYQELSIGFMIACVMLQNEMTQINSINCC